MPKSNLKLNLDPRPIGVFDSGVGGLSVLNHLIQTFPNESFVYLGDTARLPYGSKSPTTIQRYVTQNINYLIEKQNIKAVVVACNSASTVLKDIDIESKISIFGVIIPGSKAAFETTKNKKIAIWATRATVKQESYSKALKDLDSKIKSFQVPCPLLVPIVEEGLWDSPITDSIIDLYLNQLKDTDVDTLILGCTHYPFIRKSIEARIVKQGSKLNLKLNIVDSAKALSDELETAFKTKKIIAATDLKTNNSKVGRKSSKANSKDNLDLKPEIKLLLTDEASHFMTLVLKTFPDWKNIKFQLIDLHQIV